MTMSQRRQLMNRKAVCSLCCGYDVDEPQLCTKSTNDRWYVVVRVNDRDEENSIGKSEKTKSLYRPARCTNVTG